MIGPWRAARSVATHLAVWLGVLVLAPVAIAVAPLSRGSAVLAIGRLWARWICWVAGVRILAHGKENLTADKPQVIVANHQGNFDIYAIVLAAKVPSRYLAKKELFSLPLFGWALKVAGFPKIDRQNSASAQKTIKETLERVRRDRFSILAFPEGTRNTGKGLLPFRKGAFVLAIQLGVPVVPAVINGSSRIQARKKFLVNSGTVSVTFLQPIPTEGLTYDDRDKVLESARAAIYEYLDEADR